MSENSADYLRKHLDAEVVDEYVKPDTLDIPTWKALIDAGVIADEYDAELTQEDFELTGEQHDMIRDHGGGS